MDQDSVTKFTTDANALIAQLVELAGKGPDDTSAGLVRQLRVAVGALMSACDSAGRPAPPQRPPMQPRPVPGQAQPAPTPAATTTTPPSGRRS